MVDRPESTTVEASAAGQGRNKRIMEALVLALGGSEVCKIINVGTLRYFIEFTFRDMFNGAAFDLGPLWNVLAAEPGLTEQTITPPLLLFKQWEGRLGVSVVLPKALAELPQPEIDEHLARISVKAGELERVLHDLAPARPAEPSRASPAAPGTPAAPAAPAASAAPAVPVAAGASASGRVAAPARSRLSDKYLGSPGAPTAPTKRSLIAEASAAFDAERAAPPAARRRVTVVVCGTLAAAALVFIGLRLFGSAGSGYSTARFDSVLRIEDARRVDFAVSGTVTDARWESLPRAEQVRLVDQVFRAIEPDGVRSLLLKDRGGRTRAVASTVGGRRELQVE
jgi:hypothetical protein